METSVEIGVEIFLKMVRDAYKGVIGYAQEHDFFKTATRTYLRNLREDFGEVRVLGMKERVQLDSLYVRANILEKISMNSGEQADELDRDRDILFGAFSKTVETVDGEEIINHDENLLVLGKPGAGKTTYLKYLSLRMASQDKNSKIEKRRLPVFLTLHTFAKSGLSLQDYMIKQFDLCGFEQAGPFLERMLTNGDCLILLDGLDEVSREIHLDNVIQEITDFTRKYRESRFVVSCRIATYNHWFPKFKEIEIADFNEAQIEDFTQKYFQKEQETGAACWQKLKGNKRLLEIASSPLLLTLLCITYDERQDFPPNRALLYGQAMNALLNKWDAERRIKRDKLYRDLDEARLKQLLSRLAWGHFENNTYFFSEEELEKGISQFLVDLLGEEAHHKGKEVLRDIEEHYGLIVRRSRYAFSFSHLTFLEYFTARHIVDKALNGSIDELIENHFGDDRWLEVFLLTAGKLGAGVDEFLLKMHYENRKILLDEIVLNNLLRIIQSAIIPIENKYPKLVREWTALFLSFNALRINSHTPFTYASTDSFNSSLVFVQGIALELGIAITSIFRNDFVRGHINDGDRGINLDLLKPFGKANNVNLHNLKNINIYIKRNLWIVQCLQSGATISTTVREKILSDMFRPLDEVHS